MNAVLREYFQAIEERLIGSPAILSYQITRQEIGAVDGKIRIRALIQDGGQAEFFVYAVEENGRVRPQKYSYHWQDRVGGLRRRWDNAPHHSELPGAPHHVHEGDREVRGLETPPDIFEAILQMERIIDPGS